MNLQLTQDELRVLRRHLTKYRINPEMFNAVYVPPAAQLRQQADEMEQDERDYPILRGIVEKLRAL